MLDDIAGTYGSRLFVAAGGVAVALLVLVGVLWLVRNRAPSPFVRGGKGRQQRLQVLDAAAIDARRRIVLIRRDGVEHLVMIGGPTDLVIESGIGDTSRFPTISPVATVAPPPQPPQEAIAAREPRTTQQLESPREAPRVASRPAEPAAQLSPPPSRVAIEAPAAAMPERRAPAEPKPLPPTPAPVIASVEPASPVPQVERPQPPVPPAPPERIEPVVFERKEEAAAADILEAARNRVLAPQPERPPEVVAAPAPSPNPVQPAPILVQDAYSESYEVSAPDVAPPRKLGSDFESVLEAEMSNTLTAERVVQNAPPPPAQPRPEPIAPQQRPEPVTAPVTGGDAALQKEVARIFGEMSVSRDK